MLVCRASQWHELFVLSSLVGSRRDKYARHMEEQQLFVSQVQHFIEALGKTKDGAVGANAGMEVADKQAACHHPTEA